jgi:hypothetical protein
MKRIPATTVVALRDRKRLSFREIAAQLKVTENGVRYAYKRQKIIIAGPKSFNTQATTMPDIIAPSPVTLSALPVVNGVYDALVSARKLLARQLQAVDTALTTFNRS